MNVISQYWQELITALAEGNWPTVKDRSNVLLYHVDARDQEWPWPEDLDRWTVRGLAGQAFILACTIERLKYGKII